MSAARFGIDMWYCYISVRLADLCAHSIIGFAIAEDEELTITEEFSGIGIRNADISEELFPDGPEIVQKIRNNVDVFDVRLEWLPVGGSVILEELFTDHNSRIAGPDLIKHLFKGFSLGLGLCSEHC